MNEKAAAKRVVDNALATRAPTLKRGRIRRRLVCRLDCHRIYRRALALCLALLLAANTVLNPLEARRFSTVNVVTETVLALPNCMKWSIIGLCFWLTCRPWGCYIRVSVLIGNYNPDLVISGYQRPGENPWVEMAALYGPPQVAAAQGIVSSLATSIAVILGTGDRANEKFALSHEALNFQEADAIGHPISDLWEWLQPGATPFGAIPDGFGLNDVLMICPSETKPFVPYLLSGFDATAWRWSIPELFFPQSWVPGMREIGRWPLNSWQAVYPRSGFTIQDEPPKAAAIVVQRAGDVVTRDFQPHVYTPTSITRPPTSGLKVFWPGGLKEANRKTGYFSMHSPYSVPRCEAFGQNDVFRLLSWADLKVDRQDDYAWTLWRPYKCCKRRGDTLLFVMQFVIWPP